MVADDGELLLLVVLDIARGDNLTLSTLRGTVHLGAHADAPSHYGADAPTIDRRDLDPYLGSCTVIDVDVPRGTWLGEQDLLDLEREAFLSLCGESKTHQRIMHMLNTGKPLRN